MSSLSKQVRALQAQVQDLMDGAYQQATPLGPGRVTSTQLKAKSIISNLLNVTDLQSVATNTGALTVTGALTAGSGANTMAYDPSNGLFIGASSFAAAPFRVAPTGAMVGTSVNITGTVSSAALSATGGSIGTFGISATDGMVQGTGSSTRGISVGTTAFYAGAADPATAPFRVDRFGNAAMTNATISGSSTFSGSLSGASGSFSGSLSGATGTFSGGVTASSLALNGALSFGASGSIALPGSGSITNGVLDINSATFAGITVDGTITLGAGGKIIDADGSYWDQNGIVLVSSGSFGDAIRWKVGGADVGSIYATGGGGFIMAAYSGKSASIINWNSAGYTVGPDGESHIFMDSNNKPLTLHGNGGSSATLNFASVPNGGSASNWSAFTVANVIDKAAGYFKLQIGGVNYRVPFFADG